MTIDGAGWQILIRFYALMMMCCALGAMSLYYRSQLSDPYWGVRVGMALGFLFYFLYVFKVAGEMIR